MYRNVFIYVLDKDLTTLDTIISTQGLDKDLTTPDTIISTQGLDKDLTTPDTIISTQGDISIDPRAISFLMQESSIDLLDYQFSSTSDYETSSSVDQVSFQEYFNPSSPILDYKLGPTPSTMDYKSSTLSMDYKSSRTDGARSVGWDRASVALITEDYTSKGDYLNKIASDYVISSCVNASPKTSSLQNNNDSFFNIGQASSEEEDDDERYEAWKMALISIGSSLSSSGVVFFLVVLGVKLKLCKVRMPMIGSVELVSMRGLRSYDLEGGGGSDRASGDLQAERRNTDLEETVAYENEEARM
jgi:hypothetical protein